MLEQGETEQAVVEMAVRTRRPIPPKILNAPVLQPELFLFYEAFVDLTTDRSTGMGEGPIPWSSIVRYAEVYDFTGDQREDLLHIIRQMDKAYLKFRRDEAKAA